MSKYFSWLSLFLVATLIPCSSYADKPVTVKFQPRSIIKELNSYVNIRYDIKDFIAWSDKDLKNWLSNDKYKFNLLYFSVYNKNDKLSRYLIGRGVNPIALNIKSKTYNFYNALGYAAVANTNDDARLHDAIIAMVDGAFKYPKNERVNGLAVALWMTIDSGNKAMSKLLIENGAESPIDNEIMPIYINAIVNGESDKLLQAIKYLKNDKKKQLLKDSLYAAAIWYKNDDVAQALKKTGAKESLYSYLADENSNGNIINKISAKLLTINPETEKVNMLKSFGFTPLVWSLSSSSILKVGAVKELTDSELNDKFQLKICGETYTPASYIIKYSAQRVADKEKILANSINVFDYLKDEGINMLLTPRQAMSYKKVAMDNDSPELLKMLMSCKVKMSNSEVNIHDKILAQWLMESVLLKKNNIAKMLEELELPIKKQMDKSIMFPSQGGSNALRAAVGYLNADFARYLIEQGKALNLDERDIMEFVEFMSIVVATNPTNEDAVRMLDILRDYMKQLDKIEQKETSKSIYN